MKTFDYPIDYNSHKISNKVAKCRSPIEYTYFKELDSDPEVIQYTPEPFKIPYQYNGKTFNYIPDVLVEQSNGIKKLVEIKIINEVSMPINIAKINAAKEYARLNKMIFRLVVRYVKGAYFSLPFEGEYKDWIDAEKDLNRWVVKRKLERITWWILAIIAFILLG